MKNKFNIHDPTTSTELQAPDFGQTHKEYGALNIFVSARLHDKRKVKLILYP